MKILLKITLYLITCFFIQPGLASVNQTIALDSEDGRQILLQTKLNTSYLLLSANYTTQKNQAYCSIASSVMVLNALKIKPLNLLYDRYYYIDQDNFFYDPMLEKNSIVNILKCGLTLDELAVFLKYYPVDISVTHAADSNYDEFILKLKQIFANSEQYMIADFYRPSINQCGGGHFSPLAAYDSKSNKILVMDVARYKFLPYWIDAEDLWNAMNTIDDSNNLSRGFIIVKKL